MPLTLVACLPDMPPTPLTILTLVWCLPDLPLMLLTILTLAVPSRHASDAPYHPYAHAVPSQHASDAPYHPYCPPNMPPMPPETGLIVKAAYNPYAPASPSR
ncbi:hypothetical protein O181_049359 [Austropuccinia psidii MF-1]|uniref:Uncharacterized protein n=1 Tax=Austropuccinia psidii MF-1 TaxID=1389203 RepID=A0A9Q3DUN6_9BASI|nr:hypothetical protein [Austropuccinia psidii MF-1]